MKPSSLIWIGVMALLGLSVVAWLITNYGQDAQGRPFWYTILLTDVFGLLMLLLTVSLGVEVYNFQT